MQNVNIKWHNINPFYMGGGGYQPLNKYFQPDKMLVSVTKLLQLILGSSFAVILAIL